MQGLASYSKLTRELLAARGITAKKEAESFLRPIYEDALHDPFLASGMKKAVGRILKAIDAQERIVIFGDYDCDGIPGASLLYAFFSKIGYKQIDVYIPHRYTEGYGLNIAAIEELQKKGTGLIITVDCGITDVEPVAKAHELGVDIIITDHHLPHKKLPKAYAIINHKKKGDSYPFKFLSGSGTAFKLVQALLQEGNFKIAKGWEKWLLDLAGLATIADMVPLTGENRIIAYYGLKVLRKTPRIGIRELLKKKSVRPEHLTEDDVGFTIGPHINAASRMGNPYDAFKLLTTEDADEAKEIVARLMEHNADRKVEVQSIIAEVEAIIHEHAELPVIVIGHSEWKPGIVGLAANMIAEKYGKPAFVWGKATSTQIKGSCRSDGQINMVDLMNEAKTIFTDFGGHELAGGFSLLEEHVHMLPGILHEAHVRIGKSKREKREGKIKPIAELAPHEVTWKLFDEINQFAPFGVGNEKPVFEFKNVELSDVRRFGKEGIHTELLLYTAKKPLGAIKFFAYDEFASLGYGDRIDLLATLEKSTFKYPHELRLRIMEWNKI